MNILGEYKKFQENRNTLITIYFYFIKKEECINFIQKELNKISTIQNTSIKTKLNNRLYNLKLKIDKLNDDISISSIYLLNEEINEYKLEEKEKEVLKEYNCKNIYISNNVEFELEYINNLLYNFDFNYSCLVEKSQIIINKINSTKMKELCVIKFVNEKNLVEIINDKISEYKIEELYIHTKTNFYKSLVNEKNSKYICFDEEYTNDKLLEKIKISNYEKNHLLLDKRLKELSNPNTNLDLFVFGRLKKEILEAIESFSVKELYIEERKIIILKDCLDDSHFNFKIIPIISLKEGDIGSKFIDEYKGLMCIKYY